MWNELGLSGGTAIIILIALYFVIKWAVKNGIKEAYSAITGKKTEEDVRNEKELVLCQDLVQIKMRSSAC